MDDVDYFEDALFTVFEHHQPAHGDPGTEEQYQNDALPAWCINKAAERCLVYRIPMASSSNTKLFAHHQWDAGVHLADMVVANAPIDVRGRRVIELGAGTGLPSLAAAAQGAAYVVVSDYPDADILHNLEVNVARLQAQAHAQGLPPRALHVAGLAWGDKAQERYVHVFSPSSALCEDGQYDIVLAADVLWVSSQHENLLHSICALLRRDAAARCIVVAGFHTGRPATARFFEAARTRGLALDVEAPFHGWYERSFRGEERAWQGAEDMGDISERGQWVVVACLKWAEASTSPRS